jgi:hypothetical protein
VVKADELTDYAQQRFLHAFADLIGVGLRQAPSQNEAPTNTARPNRTRESGSGTEAAEIVTVPAVLVKGIMSVPPTEKVVFWLGIRLMVNVSPGSGDRVPVAAVTANWRRSSFVEPTWTDPVTVPSPPT